MSIPESTATVPVPWPGDSFRDRRGDDYRVICVAKAPAGGIQVVYRRVRDGLHMVLPLPAFRDAFRRVRTGQRKRKVG